MKYLLLVIFFILCNVGCQQNQHGLTSIVTRKSDITKAFKKKPETFYYQYDSSISEVENYDRGWIDTFSVKEMMFQILSNPNGKGVQLQLQVYKDGQWQSNLNTYFGNYGIDHNNDMNNDGFTDFQFFINDSSWVYFYNDTTKKFDWNVTPISHDFELIDSNANIYYQVWRQNKYRGVSDLYKFNGRNQYFLYRLKAVNYNDNEKSFSALRLYKCSNGIQKDTVFLRDYKQEGITTAFNYKKFWKEVLLK